MEKYLLSDIAKYIGGDLYGKDKLVSSFSIDSRTISNGDVYICIKGKNYDGHDFIRDCIKKSSCIITSKDIDNINLSEKSYIKISDTVKALQDISQYVRNKSNAKFIAITGSNGKTTVKEMVAHILSDYKISYTKGNLNNHIGVPLTLLSINQDEDFIIVEIGSNNLGEIEPLAKIVRPDVAAVTNIGYAHIEGFKNLNNTAKEKFSLFKHIQKDGYTVINNQDKFRNILKRGNKIYFGYSKNFYNKIKKILRNILYETNFLTIRKIKKNVFTMEYKQTRESLNLNLNGDHNFMNAGCAISIAISLGIKIEEIKKKLETFEAISSRLKLHKLGNNINIIDDCYNANPSSFKAAISFLSTINQKKIVLMGDMVELGKDADAFHLEIGKYAKIMGVSKFLSIGKYSKVASDVFGINGYHFKDAESLKSYLNNNLEPSTCILIKGSRSSKLEEYVQFLKTRSY